MPDQIRAKDRRQSMIWLGAIGGAAFLIFLILNSHGDHLLSLVPLLVLLACPLMHMFMHHGHGRRGEGRAAFVPRAREDGAMTGNRSRPDEAEYFRTRALQEQLAATNARCPKARRCHDELAMMYRFRVAMLAAGPGSWGDSLAHECQPQPA